jgi:hypothetical protein
VAATHANEPSETVIATRVPHRIAEQLQALADAEAVKVGNAWATEDPETAENAEALELAETA